MKRHAFLMLVLAAALGAPAFLSGCASDTSAGARTAELTFANLAPLPLSIAYVDVYNKFDPGTVPGDISTQFRTPPGVALQRYAKQRYRAAGNSGAFNFNVLQASVTARSVKPEDRITRALELNQQMEYTLTMKVGVEAIDRGAVPDTRGSFTVARVKTLPANISIAERERMLQDTVVNMIMELDRTVQLALRDNLKILSATDTPVAVPTSPYSAIQPMSMAPSSAPMPVPVSPTSAGGSVTAQPLD